MDVDHLSPNGTPEIGSLTAEELAERRASMNDAVAKSGGRGTEEVWHEAKIDPVRIFKIKDEGLLSPVDSEKYKIAKDAVECRLRATREFRRLPAAAQTVLINSIGTVALACKPRLPGTRGSFRPRRDRSDSACSIWVYQTFDRQHRNFPI